MDLRYQGVHGPNVEPPIWEQVANTSNNTMICGAEFSCQIMASMCFVVDAGIANVTATLRQKGMWSNTLMIFFGDNGGGAGGTEPSNNYRCVGPRPSHGRARSGWQRSSRAG